ncbi:S28 family serine protease [Fodinicola feengrottensis]|uniref:S28 family serine protease n=1 Tax=Fodinicola feengrottensis TaxID=435914 RepID=A0ABN2I613_9ACTN
MQINGRRLVSGVVISLLAILCLAGGTTAAASAPPAGHLDGPPGDITAELSAIPGLTVVSDQVLPTQPNYRYYDLEFRQAIDHHHPEKGTFEQRLWLLHKSVDRPMVLFTTGYNLYKAPAALSEPTTILDADQLSVEQRYFSPSRPVPTDWSKLTIWQAATDHHTIVSAFKRIYHGKWIETGGSKGGMTAVYHRRFYPYDVDATVAYVAPDNTDVNDNSAYDEFFATVGTPQCRAALNGLQQEALDRRADMEKLMAAAATARNLHYTVFGSMDRAYERNILHFRWAFWQSHTVNDCAGIPDRTASTEAVYAYIDSVEDFSSNSDESTDTNEFVPYHYQASTQLGGPYPSFSYLTGLRYPGVYGQPEFVPRDIPVPAFDPTVMPDIDRWVRTSSCHLMFLYAANDPWGAKPFRLGPGSRDSYWYDVAGQDHIAALISVLPAPQHDQAVATLRRWAGLTQADQTTATAAPALRS